MPMNQAEAQEKPKKLHKLAREWGEAFIEAFIIFLVLYVFFWPVKIDGPSMEHTFYTGERVVVSRVLTWFKQYGHEDIIICKVDNGGKSQSIIKRIIAMPGDHLVIENGVVTVNGQPLEEPYAQTPTNGQIDLTISEDCVYVLGDNRFNSVDSRRIGEIPIKDIKGKVFLRILPLNKISLF